VAGSAESLVFVAGAWLLTWLIHSTALLGVSLVVTRVAGDRIERARELLWRTALFGPLVTATAQLLAPVAPARRLFMNSASHGIFLRGALVAQPAALATSHRWMWIALALLVWGTVLAAAIGVLRCASVLVAGRRWRTSLGPRAIHPALSARTTRLANGWAVRVSIAPGAVTPMALGLREVCLPTRATSELSDDQLDAVLLHELAHLRRRDPLWLGAAAIVRRLLWLQPLQRMALAEIRAAAEIRCDAWALSQRVEPIALAGALAMVSEWMMGAGPVIAAAAVQSPDSLALARVRRILTFDGNPVRSVSHRWGLTVAAVMLFCATALLPGFSPATRGWAFDRAAPTYTISAVDDAGPFTVTLRQGRIVGMTMAGRPLDRSHIRQTADRILVRDRTGRITLELRLTPDGGMSWHSRPVLRPS
jgi:bla regulator protein blaR1